MDMPAPTLEHPFFTTHRVPIAAFLMSRGQLLDHNELVGHTVHFSFREKAACEKLQAEFLMDDSPEKTFWQKSEDLRSIVIALLPRQRR